MDRLTVANYLFIALIAVFVVMAVLTVVSPPTCEPGFFYSYREYACMPGHRP
jgi:hypothetical protein